VVLGSNGAPLQAMVNVQSATLNDGLPFGNRNGRSGADGLFTLQNVPPGTYTLEVTGRGGGGRGGGGNEPPEVASVPITVSGEDLLGLTIATTKGAVVTGTISTDNGARVAFTGMRVTAPPMRAAANGFTPRSEVAGDGAFMLAGLIGPRSFRFDQVPSGWAVKSITVNGVDVSDVVMEFRGTEEAAARVVLTNKIAEVTGTVQSDTLVRGSSVLVFPDDETKWNTATRYVWMTRPGDEGQFTLRGLPPFQRYLAIALDYIEGGEQLDPAFLQRVKPLTTNFSLMEGEKKTLSLRLVPRP
jgi:hypothetical protein